MLQNLVAQPGTDERPDAAVDVAGCLAGSTAGETGRIVLVPYGCGDAAPVGDLSCPPGPGQVGVQGGPARRRQQPAVEAVGIQRHAEELRPGQRDELPAEVDEGVPGGGRHEVIGESQFGAEPGPVVDSGQEGVRPLIGGTAREPRRPDDAARSRGGLQHHEFGVGSRPLHLPGGGKTADPGADDADPGWMRVRHRANRSRWMAAGRQGPCAAWAVLDTCR